MWDIATGEQLRVLRNPAAKVIAATFSPKRRMAATADDGGVVRLWDLASGKELARLRNGDYAYGAAFSPDGRLLVSAGDDGTARLWDVATGELVRSWNGPTDFVWSAAFSPSGDRIVTGNEDGTARVWDTATVNPRHRPSRTHGCGDGCGLQPRWRADCDVELR